MAQLALAPVLVFALVSAVVAIRLLRLGLATRALPELAVSGGLLLISLIGMPMSFAGRTPALLGTGVGDTLFLAGLCVSCVGVELFFVFTWCVFRRESIWARAILVAAAGGLALVVLGFAANGTGLRDIAVIGSRVRPWSLGMLAIVGGAFFWTAIESLHYWRLARRRLRLGLADPVVVNRFFLWGLSGLATAVLCGAIGVTLGRGGLMLQDPVAMGLVALTGCIDSVAWTLSFLPPAAYLRLLRARAEAAHR